MPEEMLTVRDLKERLKLGTNSIYALVARADFPKLVIGRSIRIPIREFEKWQNKQLPGDGEP